MSNESKVCRVSYHYPGYIKTVNHTNGAKLRVCTFCGVSIGDPIGMKPARLLRRVSFGGQQPQRRRSR